MPKTLRGSFDQAPALCCYGRSSLPFARPQMPQTLRGSFEQALKPLPSVVKGVQACRLPGLKCLKRCAAASSRHSGHCPLLLRAFKPAVCQASNASNAARQLRAGTQSGHCPLLLRAFKPSVCQASNASNAARQLRGSFEQALRPLPSVVKGVQACRLPGLKCLKRCAAASSRHSGHCPLLSRAFKPAVCQASNASNAARQLRAGTQATALCCYGRSSLPFARPHMPQATALLLLRAFKPAVCQASNASNAARQLRAGTQATALCC